MPKERAPKSPKVKSTKSTKTTKRRKRSKARRVKSMNKVRAMLADLNPEIQTTPLAEPESVTAGAPAPAPVKVRRKRIPMTIENQRARLDEHIALILKEIDDRVAHYVDRKTDYPGVSTGFRRLRTKVAKLTPMVRQFEKVKKKNARRRTKSSTPTGFQAPCKVTDEMESFGVAHGDWKEGDLHSRVDITRLLCAYVRDNNLGEGREIHADDVLQNLLQYDPDTADKKLTYATMQKHVGKLLQ